MKTFITTATLVAGLTLSGIAMADQQGQLQGAHAASGATAGALNKGNNQAITIEGGEATKIPKQAPSIAAPALTTTLSETCMGSTSMGFSGAGFGLTFGSTWRDEACVRRLDSREIRSFGAGLPGNQAILFHLAAKERMCEDEKIRAAFARVHKMTDNADALCQQTADEYTTASASRAADRTAGIVQTPTEVASRDVTQQERNERAWEHSSGSDR